jgi:hypothetical protein
MSGPEKLAQLRRLDRMFNVCVAGIAVCAMFIGAVAAYGLLT